MADMFTSPNMLPPGELKHKNENGRYGGAAKRKRDVPGVFRARVCTGFLPLYQNNRRRLIVRPSFDKRRSFAETGP